MSMTGYVTAEPGIFCGKLKGGEVTSFCDFWEMTSCDFTFFSQVWLEKTFVFWDVLDIRSIKVYLYPTIINFDAEDFSEHRSE